MKPRFLRGAVASLFGLALATATPAVAAGQIPDTLVVDTLDLRGRQPQGAYPGQRFPVSQYPRAYQSAERTPEITASELLDRIRQSGLSRAEVEQRLGALGYPAPLADPYFDTIERGTQPPTGMADGRLLHALNTLGVPVPVPPGLTAERAPLQDTIPRDTAGLPIFGQQIFQSASTSFMPITTGPVGPGYRLGPGDELVLLLTGDVESVNTLPVTREGFVVIPDVGQVFVSGLTLGELESRLYGLLGRVYSGVGRGPEATTHFQISLGALRTNQVYVIGEVLRPGAYEVGATATPFEAMYRSWGPRDEGSFRRVLLRRGGQVVETIDLYDYLLAGEGRTESRLQNGDVLFVPLAGAQVAVEGAVRRPAVYELVEGEGLRTLLDFAGGFAADAVVRRVQIDRILPPERRTGGADRVIVDVPIERLLDMTSTITLHDGDRVRVFAVSDERRNQVVVTGEVRRPGLYEFARGMTLWDLIGRADGLDEDAYLARAQIYRLNESTGARRLIPAPLITDSAGRPATDVVLADRDSVVIYSRAELRNEQFVTIGGFVKSPGTYPLAEGMTLQDLVLTAGGFIYGAYTPEADVARPVSPLSRTDTTARIFSVPLAEPAGDLVYDAGEVPDWAPASDDFVLAHGDRVFVRRAPGYAETPTVTLGGEFVRPGDYVLSVRGERLSDVVQRAGGVTDQAYLPGLRLMRDSSLLATDLERAIEEPDSRFNLVLETGDSLFLPQYDPSVLVTGAVGFDVRILYEEGEGVEYYVNRAGGYTDVADEDRVSVRYPDGERVATRSILGVQDSPDVRPGSTIIVPEKPPSERAGVNWDSMLARVMTLITVLLAVREL